MAKLLSTIVDGFISSRKFISGLLGEGWKIWRTSDNRYKLEIDDVVVRNTMTVFELLISKIRAIKGALGITQASGKVKAVREEAGRYYLEIEEEMSFMAHDIVRCMEFNGGLRSYWVEVAEVNGQEIGVIKSEFGEVIPQAGDELVQFGNTMSASRQSAIYLHADENGVPAIDVLQGIDGKTFEGKVKLRVGGLDDITDTDFPEGVSGFGIYSQNGYFKGTIAGAGVYLLRPDGSGYLAGGGIRWDKNGNLTFGSQVVLDWENLSPETRENLKGEKGDPGQDGIDGSNGIDGHDGLDIVWKGDASTPPANPVKNWVYRNTDSGVVYIYNGSAWVLMIADGNDGTDGTNGKDGNDGWNVYITYSDSGTDPTTPTGNGTSGGWHTDATSKVIWMSQKVAADAAAGTWGKPIRIKGEQGAAGPAGEDANLLPWIKEWDDNKTQLGANYVISPKIFAGTNSGTAATPVLTGVAIGREVITADGKKTGIFGLNNGKITFSIDAETGEAMYRGQMDVNGKCKIDKNGKLTATEAVIVGDVTATGGKVGGFIISNNDLKSSNLTMSPIALEYSDDTNLTKAVFGGYVTDLNVFPISYFKIYIKNDLEFVSGYTNQGVAKFQRNNMFLTICENDVLLGMQGGSISGFGMKTIRVTASYTIKGEGYVVVKNTSKITITLPSGDYVWVGRTVYVRLLSSEAIILRTTDGKKILASTNEGTSVDTWMNSWSVAMLVWDGVNWLFNQMKY